MKNWLFTYGPTDGAVISIKIYSSIEQLKKAKPKIIYIKTSYIASYSESLMIFG